MLVSEEQGRRDRTCTEQLHYYLVTSHLGQAMNPVLLSRYIASMTPSKRLPYDTAIRIATASLVKMGRNKYNACR